MGTRYRYSEADLARAVEHSFSIAGVMRILGVKPAGGSHFHMSNRIRRAQLDTSHFTGQRHNSGKKYPKLRAEEVLVTKRHGTARTKVHLLRRALAEIGVEERCASCLTQATWQGLPLIHHVNHIDGNPRNCLRENLRYLCPNCHSQTPSYCRKMSSRGADDADK